ncbi:unnamed protein product [marine sediment metagenome]|uniref:Uncharacterized protein n=1 Tax=marine sediment metagenome TaxID=412755 RepID=X0S2D2_9ZZZZ
MAQIRVSATTYERLVLLKRGMDTFDDVILRLLLLYGEAQSVPPEPKKLEKRKGG